MKVTDLAKSLDVTPDTVRYYTRVGFLSPLKSVSNGYKEYSKSDSNRLRFIISARQIGFSVKDIKQILQHAKDRDTACPIVRKLIEQRLDQTEVQFQHIRALRNKMKTAISQWQTLPDQNSSNENTCHLIESFISQNDNNHDVKQRG